ncbi:MAG: tRNA 4-thiouridine(8) synthase ThiI, partial [Planctomycetes bacterium]|nr:tRNA 4-thiouridine(8) synthase ThiI [Planctomycetota bacterium]
RQAGTFDISIQPHDDCCSYLMPRAPMTKSKDWEAERIEECLDVPRMVEECLAGAEMRELFR